MSAEPPATEQNEQDNARSAAQLPQANNHAGDDDGETEDDDEEEEEEDEPKLKYAKLTGSLTNVYRGDSTSAFIVAGDKVVLGTHNGNVHVLQLPGLQPLKTYHAHSATITSISVSPVPPPPKPRRSSEERGATTFSPPSSVRGQQTQSTSSPRTTRTAQPQIPNTPNNQIYIATSSLDGHVCINSLLDPKDVQLRNFARPVSAVALSPDYKNDRTFLSGGLAGQLILTVGGKAGITIDANTNSAAAAATGWFGSIGLGADRGRDQVLHSGEGSISTIKWSRTGKWVVWVNEEGIKIMRSHLKLGSEDSEDAWRRIAHAAKPNYKIWKEMAGVWKGRCEWVDEKHLESDEDLNIVDAGKTVNGINGMDTVKSTASKKAKKVEKLLVGWGDSVWGIHVQEGGTNAAGKRQVGSANFHRLQFNDYIISGVAQFTPTLVAVLAYRTKDDDDQPVAQRSDKPKKGRQHRQNGLAPHLRLVKMDETGDEVDLDELSISRFESLSAQDYHLGSLWIPPPPPSLSSAKTNTDGSRGALEGLWDAAGGKYASKMFSSSASVMSRSSSGKEGTLTSPPSSIRGVPPISKKVSEAHPFVEQAGLKLWVISPYDCVLAIKRDEGDRLEWLLERQMYQQAWELIDLKPEVVDSSTAEQKSLASGPSTPLKGARQDGSLADFFADDSRSDSTLGPRAHHSIAQKEKRRIADLWLQQLVNGQRWEEAGKVAGRVLNTGSRWEHWVLTFAQKGKFDEITPFLPAARQEDDDVLGTSVRIPSLVYEVVLGHYISTDPHIVGDLLEKWDPEAFDARSVIAAIEARLDSGELKEDSPDSRILMEALGKLYLSDGRAQDALRCWIRTQNADKAMELIRTEKLVDVVASEDVAGLLMLRVTKEMLRDAPIDELDAATSEVTALLVEAALRGTVAPSTIIDQLSRQGPTFKLFTFFYLRALWNASSTTSAQNSTSQPQHRLRGKFPKRIEEEGHALVSDHAELALQLFAAYDRNLLLDFLSTSTTYPLDQAASICEQRHYIPELVYVLSKTGQTKRALFLIIGELGDVKQAIKFAKDNPDLWDDLLEYSMDKPTFIKGLLEEVGTAIDPIELVRRIPEGLEIEGLKEGVQHMMRAYDVQFSLSEGAAKVLRGEVVGGMDTLRAGRRKGVRFEVVHEGPRERDVDLEVVDPPTRVEGGEALPVPKKKAEKAEVRQHGVKPGHCVGCGEVFHEEEKVPLLGFACGHVYHLPCLLRSGAEPSSEREISRLLSQLGYSEDEPDGRGADAEADEAYTGRSVGGKVAHAHVIRNVVRGGCRCCSVAE